MLPTAFVNENFDFYSKTLTGTKELRPRWKRCVGYTNQALGEVVGQIYVDQTFGAEGKERTLAMVEHSKKRSVRTSRACPGWATTPKRRRW